MQAKGREEKEREGKGLIWVLVSATASGHIFQCVIKPRYSSKFLLGSFPSHSGIQKEIQHWFRVLHSIHMVQIPRKNDHISICSGFWQLLGLHKTILIAELFSLKGDYTRSLDEFTLNQLNDLDQVTSPSSDSVALPRGGKKPTEEYTREVSENDL